MDRPKFDLQRAVEAIARGDFWIHRRCQTLLFTAGHLDDSAACRRFVGGLIASLAEDDRCLRRPFAGPSTTEDFDVYVIEVSNEILDRYALQDAVWCIGFTLRTDDFEDEVFVLFIHPLEKSVECQAGWRSPRKRTH